MTLNGRSLTGVPLPGANVQAATMDAREAPPMVFAGRSSAPDRRRASLRVVDGVGSGRYAGKIVVRTHDHLLVLEPREVAWLEASGNYVRFHTLGETFRVRGTLTSLEHQLDPERFIRIHRSAIVNLDVIRELHPRRTGDYTVVTASGEALTMSRNFRGRVRELRRLLAS